MELLDKIIPKKNLETASAPTQVAIEKMSYLQDGFETSKSCRGRASNLKTGLETVYENYFNQCKLDHHKQERLKQPYKTELKDVLTQLDTKKEKITQISASISSTREEIQQLKQDIILVQKQPENFGIDIEHKSATKLWIGLFLLLPLSIYIFIFYISTSYSAFFKEFDPETSLFDGVFEANALAKAFQDGTLELGFVLFIPFVFFSLGYLIHMFWERKHTINYIKVAGLLLITFMFDAILAYLIDEKVHYLSATIDSAKFSVSMAVQSANFWLIIFAGFVSYIVWGLVFDMVMNENAKRDKVQTFKRSKKEEIWHRNRIISRSLKKHEKLKEEIAALKIRNTRLQSIIAGFILPIQNYKAFAVEYLKGWQKFIAAELTLGKGEQEQLITDCRATYAEHVKMLDLEADNYQNKVYTPTF